MKAKVLETPNSFKLILLLSWVKNTVPRDWGYIVKGIPFKISTIWDFSNIIISLLFLLLISIPAIVDGKFIPQIPNSDVIDYLALSDGLIISHVRDDGIKIYDLKLHKIVNVINEHPRVIALSRTRNLLFLGMQNGDIKILDPLSGKKLCSFKAHINLLNSLALSGDEKFIVTSGDDGIIKIWRIDPLTLIRTIKAKMEISNLRATSGYIIAFGHYGKNRGIAKIWRLVDGKLLKKIKRESDFYTISNDGKYIAELKDKITVKELMSGKKVSEMQYERDSEINILSFSQDDRYLIATNSYGWVYVWDFKSGNLLETLQSEDLSDESDYVSEGLFPITAVASDDDYVAAGYIDGSLVLWNLKNVEEPVWELKGQANYINSLKISPDKKFFAIGTNAGILKLVKPLAKNPVKILRAEGATLPINTVDITSKLIVSGGRGLRSIDVWDATQGRLKRILTKGYLGNGICLAIHSLDISSNGSFVVTGDNEGTVRIWNLKTMKFLYEIGDTWMFSLPVISIGPDNKFIAIGSMDSVLGLWEFGKKEPIWSHKLKSGGIEAIKSTKRVVITGDEGGHISFYRLKDGKRIKRWQPVRDEVKDLEVRGDTVIVGYYKSGIIVWDAKEGKFIRRLKTLPKLLTFDVSIDGKRLLSGGERGIVEVWDYRSGKKLANIYIDEKGRWIAWTDKGKWTSGNGGHIYALVVSEEKIYPPSSRKCEKLRDANLLSKIFQPIASGSQ